MARAWICPDCGFKFALGDGEYPGHWVYTHIDLAHPKEKENNMEEQMEQVWRSKDGKVTGSKEEVEAYLKSKNPLMTMWFPYQRSSFSPALIRHNGEYAEGKELDAVAAFANLAPLIQEAKKISEERADPITQWDYNDTQRSLRNLFLAYEEVLKQVPQ